MAFTPTSGDEPYQVLDPSGSLVGDRPEGLTDEVLATILYDMRLARRLDERGVSLQRQGKFGIYGEVAGQEAGFVASAHALADADWLVPSYREYPAMASRGMALRYLFAWLMGHFEGNRFPEDLQVLPLCIPVATQLLHAAGVAKGLRHRDEDGVVLVHFGDGATSEGDFHEALNFAGVFELPTVFFCNNNQWAISTPRDRQTASETIAQKAGAYGLDGVRVDGMDPMAIWAVTRWARERAAAGEPVLVEAIEYRYGAHTTSDDPDAYRDDAEVEAWADRDPLDRTEAFLRERGALDDDALAAMDARIETHLSAELAVAEGMVDTPAGMFEQVYASTPERLARQRAALDGLRERHGEDRFEVY